MKNIVPELSRPPNDADYFGEFANIKSEACLHVTSDGFVDLTYFCFFHRVLPENQFHIDNVFNVTLFLKLSANSILAYIIFSMIKYTYIYNYVKKIKIKPDENNLLIYFNS